MTRLQELRKQSGLTQEEISNKLGISQQAYGNYEKDGCNIPSKIMDKLVEILQIDPNTYTYESELKNESIEEVYCKAKIFDKEDKYIVKKGNKKCIKTKSMVHWELL